jgi:hypothetical protein
MYLASATSVGFISSQGFFLVSPISMHWLLVKIPELYMILSRLSNLYVHLSSWVLLLPWTLTSSQDFISYTWVLPDTHSYIYSTLSGFPMLYMFPLLNSVVYIVPPWHSTSLKSKPS